MKQVWRQFNEERRLLASITGRPKLKQNRKRKLIAELDAVNDETPLKKFKELQPICEQLKTVTGSENNLTALLKKYQKELSQNVYVCTLVIELY